MRAGPLNKWVTLSRCPVTTPDSDGFFEALDPEGVWAAIEPMAPSANDRTISHIVRMRFHPGVTVDTRIVYATTAPNNPAITMTRELFVKGVQNVLERNDEMRLYCEEVQP